MQIDNSAVNTFRDCPWKYYETYVKGIELIPPGEFYSPLQLGSRVHELLEEHYADGIAKYKAHENEKLEAEAQWILSAYKNHYPIESFKVLDVERTFKVALPDYCPQCYSDNVAIVGEKWCECLKCGKEFEQGRHVYTGKIDLFVEEDGELYIIDHKTEKRTAKSNLPQKWAARDQATQYWWAAEKVYGKEINRFIVNVLRRPSPAGREGPEFPERQKVERTDIQIETALRDLVVEADTIQRYMEVFKDKPWPAHRENCSPWANYQCEFYLPHLYGFSEAILQAKYQKKEEYLNLEGVPIIQ